MKTGKDGVGQEEMRWQGANEDKGRDEGWTRDGG